MRYDTFLYFLTGRNSLGVTLYRSRPWVFILRRANEHFDEIVVEAVVDLALKMPGKLRVIEIARMDCKGIRMHRHGRILQIDQNLDETVCFARGKCEKWMLVESEVVENLRKLRGVGHGNIVVELSGIRSQEDLEVPPCFKVSVSGFQRHGSVAAQSCPVFGSK